MIASAFCRVTSRVSRPIVRSQAPGEQQMSASVARLKHFGWGREGEGLSADEELFVLARAEARFGRALTESASAPPLDEIALAAPRIAAPDRCRSAPAGTTTARRTPTAS